MNRILLKQSGVSGHQPAITDLQVGEVAINTADLKLFSLSANGSSVAQLAGYGFDHSQLSNLATGDPHTQYVILSPGSATRNIIASTADVPELILKRFSGQTQPLTAWQDESGAVLASITNTGVFNGSGAGLTNLNASNIASGTVPPAQLGSGTPNATTFLRGDNTWQPVPITPAGADKQVQYNSVGSLAGDANFIWNYSSQVLAVNGATFLTANTVGTPALHVKGAAGQAANLQQWENSANTILASVGSTGLVTAPQLAIGGYSSTVLAQFTTSTIGTALGINQTTGGGTTYGVNINQTGAANTNIALNVNSTGAAVGNTAIQATCGTGSFDYSVNVTGKVRIAGNANLTQLGIQANSTQTSDLVQLTSSSGSLLSSISARGNPLGPIGTAFCPDICTARISLSNTDPSPAADQTAQSTIYLLPCNGRGMVTMYNGANFELWPLPASPVALPLAGMNANTNYDIFVGVSSGALALFSIAWSNNTARSTSLSQFGDYWYPTSDNTKRYIGTIRTTGTAAQCEDSVVRRFVYNLYNQMIRKIYFATPTAPTWTYNVATMRFREGGSGLDFQWVSGAPTNSGRYPYYQVSSTVRQQSPSGAYGVGIDGLGSSNLMINSTSNDLTTTISYASYSNVGYHFMAQIENALSGTITCVGGGWTFLEGTITM